MARVALRNQLFRSLVSANGAPAAAATTTQGRLPFDDTGRSDERCSAELSWIDTVAPIIGVRLHHLNPYGASFGMPSKKNVSITTLRSAQP